MGNGYRGGVVREGILREPVDLENAKERMRDWLLDSAIQIPDGPHRGAIAGWLDDKGKPAFAYGEITGYYLTCTAFMLLSRGDDARIRQRAERAAAWLRESCTCGLLPESRCYSGCRQHDWRNSAYFSFDLAMMIRGISNAAGFFGVDAFGEAGKAVLQRLGELVAEDGSLLTHAPVREETCVLPVKWSTVPGPFQVKTAAAILSCSEDAVPAGVRSAAEASFARWRGYFDEHPPSGDLHPLFYFMEGMVLLGLSRSDEEALKSAAKVFEFVMRSQKANGALPAQLGDASAPERSDVVAQALRMGCILMDLGLLGNSESEVAQRLGALARCLSRFIDRRGAVSFFEIGGGNQEYWNAWCAMFSYQACCFYECLERGRKLPENWMSLIV